MLAHKCITASVNLVDNGSGHDFRCGSLVLFDYWSDRVELAFCTIVAATG